MQRNDDAGRRRAAVRRGLAALLLAVAFAGSLGVAAARAQPGSSVTSGPGFPFQPGCPDGSILGPQLITSICWDCIFPIRIGGALMAPIGGSDVPAGAATQPVCTCPASNGLPAPGLTLGLWMPALISEIVRLPGCAPVLGGIMLPGFNALNIGTPGARPHAEPEKAFYHYHLYAFPLLQMLDLLVENNCNSNGMLDFDLLYLSELDPTWTYDELGFFLDPEAAAVAGPLAQAACMADAAAAAVGEPLDSLFWCAGSWGSLYPFIGTDTGPTSLPRTASLLSTRALAAMHRRGLGWRTMGNDAVCKGVIDPMIPKSQYRMSMLYPIAEANGKHPIGRSTLLWGEWRNIPAIGEDDEYLVWRWTDCCVGVGP